MTADKKRMSTGLKLVLFAIFVVAWAALCWVLYQSHNGFREGGWGMWPILAVGMVAVMIIIDRVRYLFFVTPMDAKTFQAQVHRYLIAGDVQGAVDYCRSTNKPLANIVGTGLANLHRPDDEVQAAVDERSLDELPKIEIRTGYLAMIGNIATLLGLLGTIVGLIKSFAGVSLGNATDPATISKAKQYQHLVPVCAKLSNGKAIARCIEQNKATILAKGISEAMNCTAFGLSVGIVSLLGFSVLNGRTQNMLDNISDTTVHLMNVAVGNRKSMNIS